MPRTAIPLQAVPNFGAALDDPTFTAGDAANDHEVQIEGTVMIVMLCTDASPKTATLMSVADRFGRSGDETLTAGATTGRSFAIVRSHELWGQAAGLLHIDLTDATGVSFAAFKLPEPSLV